MHHFTTILPVLLVSFVSATSAWGALSLSYVSLTHHCHVDGTSSFVTRSAATLRCSRCRSFYNTNTQQKKCHFANAVGGNRRQCNNLHSLSALRDTTVPSETDLDNDCQYDGISRTFVVEMKNCNAQQNNKNDMKDIFASSNCWGRRPFLLRGAFDPNALLGIFGDEEDDVEVGAEEDDLFLLDTPWPSWKDVVDIASDDEAEARVISHVPGDLESFDLNWGPLSKKDIRNWHSMSNMLIDPTLSDSHKRRKTLVVNDIDRYYPPLADWIYDTFRFLPHWRMDDGQISLAEKGGGIGPHVDNYDVFLIQMSGTRLWQVGKRKISAKEEIDRTIDGLDLRVLQDWGSGDDSESMEMEDWIVRPGDLLYLPPRVAHCGTALSGGSMTLSVGCRAPSVSDLISKLAEKLSTSTDEYAVRRYTDDDLLSNIKETNGDKTKPKEAKSLMDGTVGEVLAPGRLTSKAKDKAKHLVLESLTSMLEDDEFWDEFIGKYVTEQKRVRNNYPIPLEDWENDCDDSIEEDKNKEDKDVWGNAKSAVGSVLAGQGVLYHAEGISFAYSSCLSTKDDGVIVHRLFVNGEMWQSNSRQNARQNNMSRIFSTVANNRRLDQALLLRTHESNDGSISPSEIELDGDVIHFIEKLVSMGVLYGSDE